MTRSRSVAIVDPLGGYGIGTYTHELATALTSRDLEVDVYTSGRSILTSLADAYRVYPVLGSSLVRQWRKFADDTVRTSANSSTAAREPEVPGDRTPGTLQKWLRRRLLPPLRRAYFPVELALYLRWRAYDAVWTQWPDMPQYGPAFWSLCRLLGLRVVHTVHNVLPHESEPGARELYGSVYRRAHHLVVHSESAREALIGQFPDVTGTELVAFHGAYTIYRNDPEGAQSLRRELDIGPSQPIILFFGGVRAYKNPDGLLEAFAGLDRDAAILLFAGREIGYGSGSEEGPLSRTRRLVRELDLKDRVRLLPGQWGFDEVARILSAADIVALPYLETYGSGVLLLAMTFGRYVVATPSGGMDEYLARYDYGTLLEDASPGEIRKGLRRALDEIEAGQGHRVVEPPESLSWSTIVEGLIPRLRLDDRGQPDKEWTSGHG